MGTILVVFLAVDEKSCLQDGHYGINSPLFLLIDLRNPEIISSKDI